MAKRINQLDETTTIANNSYFAIDSFNTDGKTNKVTFQNIKNAILITDFNIVYLVKTFCTDMKWYRVYSDGWCEQGGKIQTEADNNIQKIAFTIPFVDTNIFINATSCGTDLGDNAGLGIWYLPKKGYTIDKEHFFYKNDLYKGEYVMWEAKGKVDLSKI